MSDSSTLSPKAAKEAWLRDALGFQRKRPSEDEDPRPLKSAALPSDGDEPQDPLVVLPPERDPVRPLVVPKDGLKEWREQMEREARAYIEEYIRVHGHLPIFDKLMRDPKFRAAIEAEDARIRREAAAEIMQRVMREKAILEKLAAERRARLAVKLKALKALGATLDKVESNLAKYLKDPNGYLLLMKQATSLDAAIEALARTPPFDTDDPEVAEVAGVIRSFRERLDALVTEAEKVEPENMAEYIESRRRHLGEDVGNSKFVDQEGQVGADIEMQFGGLTRSTRPEVEFIGGDLGPYAGVTFDVFGLTPSQFMRQLHIIVGDVWLRKLGIGGKESKKLIAVMNDKANIAQVGQYFLDVVNDGSNAPLLQGLADFPQQSLTAAELIDSLLNRFKFIDQLRKHLAKAEIVPFDVSGFNQYPGLLEAIKRRLAAALGADYARILWYDVPPRQPRGGGSGRGGSDDKKAN